MRLRHRFSLLALLVALSSLAACADIPQSPAAKAEAAAVDDPLEPMNRAVFNVNDFLDRLLIKPITELYRFAVPDYLRDRVANVVANMDEPVIFANTLLQGRVGDAGTTAARFALNTTVGVAGIFEVANDWGYQKQEGDFGETLFVWGIKNGGPYLVLPFFGPTNFRDAIGFGADAAMSPWGYVAGIGGQGDENRVNYSYAGAGGITKRDQNLDGYDALRAGSIDFYAEIRSVMRQYRDKQLGVGNANAPTFENYE